MNFNNYTQKSIEAVQSAQQLAVQNSHQQMEQVHLLLALLRQEGGLIPQLLKKMDVTVESLEAAAEAELRKIPGVRTSQAMDSFYVSADVQAAFNAAEQQAQTMKDEYVSVEHLFLGLLETARGGVKELFKTYQITKERVLKALQEVRGNQRVTTDNPEGTYDALEKIGKLCFKHHVTVISDEIHCDIVEPCKKYVPFASVCPECASNSVTCISASKAFSVAGLQSAAVFVPDERLRNIAVRGLNSDEVAEPNCFAAVATAAAFDKGEQWLDELNAYIAENKRFACEFITKNVSPVVLFDQPATYLMWLDCRDLCSDTDELCEFLRENTGLILSPGKKYRGDGRLYLRMNVACPRDKLLDGLKRFEKGVRSFSESKSKN